MLQYVIRRLLLIIPTMFFVALITFSLAHLAPGSPFDKNPNRPMSQDTIDRISRFYGVDQPIPIQFVTYLGNVVRGDFGISFTPEADLPGIARAASGAWARTVSHAGELQNALEEALAAVRAGRPAVLSVHLPDA